MTINECPMQKFINLIAICYWSREIYAPRAGMGTTTIESNLRVMRRLSYLLLLRSMQSDGSTWLINRYNVRGFPPDILLAPSFGIKFRRLFL